MLEALPVFVQLYCLVGAQFIHLFHFFGERVALPLVSPHHHLVPLLLDYHGIFTLNFPGKEGLFFVAVIGIVVFFYLKKRLLDYFVGKFWIYDMLCTV